MKGDIRRSSILRYISRSSRPVPANKLAEELGVSRQIIVKDIARLREQGEPITALSRGYVYEKTARPKRVFKVVHSDEDVKRELTLIVDLGGSVEDVFIYHKVYDKVSARMNIRSRHDVESFMEGITTGKSSLLKNVTAGYHYHTVSAADEHTLERIEKALGECGFLAQLQEYEPSELENDK